MKKEGKLLIVDDNQEILIALEILLQMHFAEVDVLANPNRIPEYMDQKVYDLILLDMNFNTGVNTGNEGLYWMKEILKRDSRAVVILITAYASIDLAIEAIKGGAADFVQKPWDDEKLISTVSSGLRLRKSQLEADRLREKQDHFYGPATRKRKPLIGNSPALQQIRSTIEKVAATEANILILGENGTGKEVVAREIHALSHRSKEVFLPVDLGAIPESLFESELFGHSKGAFTDAKEDKPGKCELASDGTLFLDELGNLPLTLQPKLLSVLQNRQVTRLGSLHARNINIRLISATNARPAELVEKGRFREDLLYRINTIQITLPPLRERREDLLPLCKHFLARYSEKYQKPIPDLSKSLINKLMDYPFPGNIRELEHLMEKAVILSETSELKIRDVFFSDNPYISSRKPAELNLEEQEKRLIRKALALHGNNYTKTSEALGITRKTLYNKMQKYAL